MAYNKLSTANLPDPTIDPAQGSSPADYFGIDTYTGNGGTIDSDFGFDCDLVWYKNKGRANTYHYLFDQVRGDDLPLYSNDNFSEDSQFPTYHTQSFITGGSRIVRTNGDHLNFSGDSYVAWAWKANGSGVSNTVGNIPSTVSANTESGFSIVSYTGNEVDNSTVGHGLSQTPEMIIVKSRSLVADWPVYHKDVVTTDKQYLYLNTTAGITSAVNEFWDVASISDTTFGLGDNPRTNNNTSTYIAYCFHSVEGYSKFGSYTGNDSPDGTFIYTGFSPALIVIKYVSGSAGGTKNWYVWDNARSPQNVNDNILYWNDAASEGGDSAFDIDMLSNGFKLRNAEGGVNNAAQYIYMAFAEQPFKYSNAR